MAGIAAACVVGTMGGLVMLRRSRAPEDGQLVAAASANAATAKAEETSAAKERSDRGRWFGDIIGNNGRIRRCGAC